MTKNDLQLQFFDSLETMINNNPNLKGIQVLVTNETWKELKRLPNMFTRGGHVYCNYRDKVYLVKRIHIVMPECNSVKFQRVQGFWQDETKQAEAKIYEEMVKSGILERFYPEEPLKCEEMFPGVKVEWNPVDLKKIKKEELKHE